MVMTKKETLLLQMALYDMLNRWNATENYKYTATKPKINYIAFVHNLQYPNKNRLSQKLWHIVSDKMVLLALAV